MRKSSRLAAIGTIAAGLILAGAGAASADATANGIAANSPGFLSGNLIQIPVHIPINVCGNSINVVGAANPAYGNYCANGGDEHAGDHGVWMHHMWWHHDDDATGWNHDHDGDCD
ncbi:chaplin [Streptacidiphilus fuscans]|uniref:Chaplin n=1 Tax=Streptacidiphilus fuscans TaxID=2789292 RepID=A0A931AZ38_9ACTN|nr:chaplin [Streptacidiphilus fuscans]MBF9068099.1 chaplin [Streptacidiphilus fuscans]